MIGIFGVCRSEPGAPADASAMVRAIAGSQNGARYTITSVGDAGATLGMVTRGSATGRQIVSHDGRWSVVVVGEIFNLEDFTERGSTPATAAELILRLFRDDATDALADINGQYCAALYDAKSHRLCLVTDRLASFPVHVWRRGGEVRFATQIYALLADPAVPRRADIDGFVQVFSLHRTVGQSTNIANVHALRGASVWDFRSQRLRKRQYWELRWQRPDLDRHGTAQNLARALRNAVSRQGMTNGAGAMLLLSGGIDSRLVLSAGSGSPPSCWTTASFGDARELKVARGVAELFDAPHRSAIVDPAVTLDCHDTAVIESNGLYPASIPFAAFVPEVARHGRLAFTGHGLDYTVRGMYLPFRRAKLGRSFTRLPQLMALPERPTGRFVLNNLRHGPSIDTIERIALPGTSKDWRARLEATLEEELQPWLDSETPANAWDALIVRSVSKHYTFTGMMSVRAWMDLAVPAFDNDVIDAYLHMPPTWRVGRSVTQHTLRILSSTAAAYPNANTGLRADMSPWLELAAVLGGAALGRLGLRKPSALPSSSHSHGSWQNVPVMFREDPGYRRRFLEIRGRLDALSMGLLDSDALAASIDEHLNDGVDNANILRHLLTHDVWVRRFGIEGIA